MGITRSPIAVTGAAGFIGSNLCRALIEKEIPVIGIDNLSQGEIENLPPGLRFHQVDILDPDLDRLLLETSTVFHLAAKNCLADCAANPRETARNNVEGTVALVNACVKAKVPHIVYADTSAEYEGVLDFPSHTDRIHPLSVYACSKLGAALMAQAICNLHKLTLTTVRYFNVYGPAQDWRRTIPPIMSAFAIKLLRGEQPTVYGTGEKRRDFIHVDDVNRFHLLLLKDPSIWGGVYNLGTGKDYSMLDIFRLMEQEICSGLSPLHKDELPGEALRTLADISGTLKTGWKPEVTLEAGLRHFIEHIKNNVLQRAKKPGLPTRR